MVQFEKTGHGNLSEPVGNLGMPKDRKKTYSDRQSEASRAKKQQKKKKAPREDFSQAAARIVKEATERT